MWNNCCCGKIPQENYQEDITDWCEGVKKVKGRFGVAFVAETPCCCPEPIGWQVEFCDTPSKVEQRCMEMIQWANRPPLPRCEPCPPVEVVSPCYPPKCNPCCPNTNPCAPCLSCNTCPPCTLCDYSSRPSPSSRKKCCCPAPSRKKCNCSRNNSKRCRCQDSDDFPCSCCPRRRDGRDGNRRRRGEGSPGRQKNKKENNVYDDEIPVKESRQRSKSKDPESSLSGNNDGARSTASTATSNENSINNQSINNPSKPKCQCREKLELCKEFLTTFIKNYKAIRNGKYLNHHKHSHRREKREGKEGKEKREGRERKRHKRDESNYENLSYDDKFLCRRNEDDGRMKRKKTNRKRRSCRCERRKDCRCQSIDDERFYCGYLKEKINDWKNSSGEYERNNFQNGDGNINNELTAPVEDQEDDNSSYQNTFTDKNKYEEYSKENNEGFYQENTPYQIDDENPEFETHLNHQINTNYSYEQYPARSSQNFKPENERFYPKNNSYKLDYFDKTNYQTQHHRRNYNQYDYKYPSKYPRNYEPEAYKVEEEDSENHIPTNPNRNPYYYNPNYSRSLCTVRRLNPWLDNRRTTRTLASMCCENSSTVSDIFNRLVRVRSMVFKLLEIIQRFLNAVFGLLPISSEGSQDFEEDCLLT